MSGASTSASQIDTDLELVRRQGVVGPDRCVRTKPVFKIYTAVDNPPVEDIVRIECVTVVRLIRCAAHTCPSIGRRQAVCPLRLSAKRTFGLEVSTSHAKPFAHSHTQSESNVRSLCGSSHVRARFGARFGASIRQPARDLPPLNSCSRSATVRRRAAGLLTSLSVHVDVHIQYRYSRTCTKFSTVKHFSSTCMQTCTCICIV